MLMSMIAHAAIGATKDDNAALVIALAPAVCFTPLGNTTYALPYQAVIPYQFTKRQPVGSQIGMDGCSPFGLQAVAVRKTHRKF